MGYGRQSITLGPTLTPVVKYLIIATVLVYFVQAFAGSGLVLYCGLTPSLVVRHLFVWQVATYLFLHGGVWHLVWNMFALWMFGSELERHWGSRRFLKYYFVTGIGAGILSIVVNPASFIPTIGASGSIYGLLLAYGMMFPDRLVYLWFLVPVKVKYLVAIFGGIAFLSALEAPGGAVAHLAHLGGMLFGYFYLKGGFPLSDILGAWRRWRLRRLRGRFRVHQNERRSREDDFWIN